MTLLVTGSNGLVGRRLCHRLIREGLSVREVVRSSESAAFLGNQVSIGSIDRATDWAQALLSIQVVIHLAARVHVMNETDS